MQWDLFRFATASGFQSHVGTPKVYTASSGKLT